MTKRRNKQSEEKKQKLLEAQHRKDYYNKLSNFCKTLTGEDIIMLLPPREKELLYAARPRAIIPEPGDGNIIHPNMIKGLKEVLIWWLKYIRVTIGNNNQQVLLYEDFYFGVPLYILLSESEDGKYKNSQKVRELLVEYFGDLNQILIRLQEEFLKGFTQYLTAVTSNFCCKFYSYSLDLQSITDLRVTVKLIINQHPIEKINVTLNHNTRPAYRIGWLFENHRFEWLMLSKAELGINKASNDQNIPVYIQMHAFNRLLERIDCICQRDIQANIYFSLHNCKAIYENGQILIEYHIFKVKVGYLQAILQEGKLIIRTFLFLTCSGTPEGKRLEEIVGLQKLDAKYLQMDKLSTYMSSKISTNNAVRAIFEKANCLNLLELFEKLDRIAKTHTENSPLEKIAEYLKDSNVEVGLVEAENEI